MDAGLLRRGFAEQLLDDRIEEAFCLSGPCAGSDNDILPTGQNAPNSFLLMPMQGSVQEARLQFLPLFRKNSFGHEIREGRAFLEVGKGFDMGTFNELLLAQEILELAPELGETRRDGERRGEIAADGSLELLSETQRIGIMHADLPS